MQHGFLLSVISKEGQIVNRNLGKNCTTTTSKSSSHQYLKKNYRPVINISENIK